MFAFLPLQSSKYKQLKAKLTCFGNFSKKLLVVIDKPPILPQILTF